MLLLLVLIPARSCWEKHQEASRVREPLPGAGSAVPAELREVLTGCDQGEAAKCRTAAKIYELGKGVPIDEEQAAILMDRACASGDRAACP